MISSEQAPPYKRVRVIINPAAGREQPILRPLNTIFSQAGIDWQPFITKKAGDARRLAQEAAAAGVDAVAAYGGDGTIMEAASGLIGSDVPLAILPGGTANIMARELGIPGELAGACSLVCRDGRTIREVDMARINGRYFLLRIGIGIEAKMVLNTAREAKDRLGWLAYLLNALKALREPPLVRYSLTLDGLNVEASGVTCVIANVPNLGITGFSLSPAIDISDGLLDVIVIEQADIGSLLTLAAKVVMGDQYASTVQHWQAREIRVEAHPAQVMEVDGEEFGRTPVSVEVLPQAVRIIVPLEKPEVLTGLNQAIRISDEEAGSD